MQIGMIGLGRMGANMVLRLLYAGHRCVVYDRNAEAVAALVREGALGAASLAELAAKLEAPRTAWMMVPAAVVDGVIDDLVPHLAPGDTIVDGGNSFYQDDIRHADRLSPAGIHFVDVGTSGGVWGLERGYCLMIGGEPEPVSRLDPIFYDLAPGAGPIERTAGRTGVHSPSERGYLHCGPSGAGHFVKMVHNGIEYALMAAYAEGFNILRHAGVGRQDHAVDAETAPLRNPRHYQYDLDLGEVAEVWRRGSVVASWLLDLTANALHQDPTLNDFGGRVSDSGEGRWTCLAAIETGAPEQVLTQAVRGQYGEGVMPNGDKVPAYRTSPGVDPQSRTETYAAMKLTMDNWRWAGVPFYLRTGKRLTAQYTEVAIQFKRAPFVIFKDTAVEAIAPDMLVLRIQPNEGIQMSFGAKIPGPSMRVGTVNMDFSYADYFGNEPATGYETLIYDCMNGDATLFKHADTVEKGWEIVQSIMDVWSALPPRDFPNYAAGTWGPKQAGDLLKNDGRLWCRIATPSISGPE